MDFEIPAMSQGLRHDSLALPFANFYLSRRDNLGQHNNVRQSTHTFLGFLSGGDSASSSKPFRRCATTLSQQKTPC